MAEGCVYLIGLGPGDPGLITVKGKQVIEVADLIVYDYLSNPLFLSWARPDCEKIFVGGRSDPDSLSLGEVVKLMIENAQAGKTVARLKDGDPFLFGRGAEELLVLQTAGVPFEVVSGVTSAVAVPAYAGIPLTYRGISPSVSLYIFSEDITAAAQWQKMSCGAKTLVFLRGVDILPQIIEKLLENGWSENASIALIQHGTLPKQKSVFGKLNDIIDLTGDLDKKAPTITVVGEVVDFHERLSWFGSKPLSGCRILVTRASHQADKLADSLAAAGAWAIRLPTIKVQPISEPIILTEALADLARFDWLIFSSTNAVDYFKENLRLAGKDVRDICGIKIICVGSATTKRVEEWGLKIDLVPTEFRAEGIIAELQRIDIKKQRFLLPRAKVAREILPEKIKELGGEVVIAPLYETVCEPQSGPPIIELLENGQLDVITFTSSSTVTHFVELIAGNENLLESIKIAAIGPVTAKTAENNGLNVDIMPTKSTVADLVGAIEEFFLNKRKSN